MEKEDFRPPPADYFLHHREHRWPAWKFGMDMDELFTTLPQQFNQISYPLLDRDAFFQDISSISHTASNREEFFGMLHQRKEMRETELRRLWLESFRNICGHPDLIGDELWPNAMHIYHYNSFDALVRFFAAFVPPRQGEALPSPQLSSTTSDHELLATRHPNHRLSANLDLPKPSITSAASEGGQNDEEEVADVAENHQGVSQSSPSKSPTSRVNFRVQKSRQNAEGTRRSRRLRELARIAKNIGSETSGKPPRAASSRVVRKNRQT